MLSLGRLLHMVNAIDDFRSEIQMILELIQSVLHATVSQISRIFGKRLPSVIVVHLCTTWLVHEVQIFSYVWHLLLFVEELYIECILIMTSELNSICYDCRLCIQSNVNIIKKKILALYLFESDYFCRRWCTKCFRTSSTFNDVSLH